MSGKTEFKTRVAGMLLAMLCTMAQAQQGPPPAPPIVSAMPDSAALATPAIVVTFALVNTTPPTPPVDVAPINAHIGPFAGANLARNGFNVTATFAIPADAQPGPQEVAIDFPAPPGQANPISLRAPGLFTITGGAPQGALLPPPAPQGNPVTPAKAMLGKALFWDEQLSSTRTVSCGTCHDLAHGGVDSRSRADNPRSIFPGIDNIFGNADDAVGSPGVPLNNVDGTYALAPNFGIGVQVTSRRSMNVPLAGYARNLFWDGRAGEVFTDPITGQVVLAAGAALESQVLGPPASQVEMAHTGRDWNDVADRVAASQPLVLSPAVPPALLDWIADRSYGELFNEAFGSTGITPARIAMAIATYERTLVPNQTPFDAAQSGGAPLTQQEQRGRNVFNQSRCNVCHAGNLFTDNRFHNTGVRPAAEDEGRFAVTGDPRDHAAFRTPSLRNVELRAPYFHNGRFPTLESVVDFYDRGGDVNAQNKDPNIRPLNLSPGQKADLLAFMRRPLTDLRLTEQAAPFDPPQLYGRSALVPQVIGAGTAGAGGFTPGIQAIEPPLVGNPSFAVGVFGALGGARAVLVLDMSDPGADPEMPASPYLASVPITLGGTGAGHGYGSLVIAIPNEPGLVGLQLFARWYVTDPAAPGGVAVTPAARMTLFGPHGDVDAAPAEGEGEGEGESPEGEGETQEGEHETGTYTGDADHNGRLNLSELLRMLQLFNSGAYRCAPGTEDGFAPFAGGTDCTPHSCDYNPPDFRLALTEILRAIQLFNAAGYHVCPGGEDGFCIGL